MISDKYLPHLGLCGVRWGAGSGFRDPAWPLSPCSAVFRVDAGIGHHVTICPSLSPAGSDNFYDGIEDMIGYRPGPWMKYSWAVVTPVLCIVSFLLLGYG